jgi:hypothetical protein
MKINQIIVWNHKYAKMFNLRNEPNVTIDNIGTNFGNILKCIL